MTGMGIGGITVCLVLGVVAAVADWAVAESVSAAAPCSLASGRDLSNNTVTCNFGLTDEQLKQVTKAAVAGATELMPSLGGASRSVPRS